MRHERKNRTNDAWANDSSNSHNIMDSSMVQSKVGCTDQTSADMHGMCSYTLQMAAWFIGDTLLPRPSALFLFLFFSFSPLTRFTHAHAHAHIVSF